MTDDRAAHLIAFVRESNKIEGIIRQPRVAEIAAHETFLALEAVTVDALIRFVDMIQPGAEPRFEKGLNVYIGNYVPPSGGPEIERTLNSILLTANSGLKPWLLHCDYESLHPFTDGNGRSGRVLWLWAMKQSGQVDRALSLGFLHTFYYQTLSNYHDR